jgi:hypothetical protein
MRGACHHRRRAVIIAGRHGSARGSLGGMAMKTTTMTTMQGRRSMRAAAGPAPSWRWALALVPMLACGGPDQRDEVTTVGSSVSFNPTTGPMGSGSVGESDDDADGTMGGGLKLDVGGADTGVDTGNECAEISDTSMVGMQPADIIVVVDNSGSMDLEAGFVQANMNVFSSQIFLANIDAHVVLISATSDEDAGICLAQPLGSGACPDDTNLPGYFHIPDGVGSNNGMQKILDHFADWAPHMRPTASKHIIMVTDDDSDLSANDFNNQFLALDASHAGYKYHAIASPEDPILACLGQTVCCPGFPLSAAISQEHIDLVNLTGGVFGNLCTQMFAPIFMEVSTAVVSGASLACEYPIPPPPDGMDFDADQVNVEFDDGMGGSLQIGRVDDPGACAGVMNGWYYDVPAAPTSIVLCPQTCDTIQGFSSASVSIKFGCATIPAG